MISAPRRVDEEKATAPFSLLLLLMLPEGGDDGVIMVAAVAEPSSVVRVFVVWWMERSANSKGNGQAIKTAPRRESSVVHATLQDDRADIHSRTLCLIS